MNANAARPTDPERLLHRLDWTVLRRLDGLFQGDYRTLFLGLGLDFAELKPYRYGDDVRTIDWNVTARLRDPHVRRFHEDRELAAWFLVDTSASMDFGSTGKLKRELVQELVGTLASLLARGGNQVGACLFDGGLPRLFPPMSGRLGVLGIVRGLQEAPVSQSKQETDLTIPLDAMAGVVRRRSLMFVISDFCGPTGWELALGRLGRRHEVLAIRIHDPGESELPDLGNLWLEDAETGSQLFIDTGDQGFRERLGQAAAERRTSLGAAFRKARVDALELSTADDLALVLLGWAQTRRYRKSRTGAIP